MIRTQYLLNGILLSFLCLWLLVPSFFTFPIWASILNFTADFGIVVLGVTLLMIADAFGLSVGAILLEKW